MDFFAGIIYECAVVFYVVNPPFFLSIECQCYSALVSSECFKTIYRCNQVKKRNNKIKPVLTFSVYRELGVLSIKVVKGL